MCGRATASAPVTRLASFLRAVDVAVARRGAAVMAICNVTPDSFSDGGRFLREEDAVRFVDQSLEEGADVVDVGGESTRPGAEPVPASEQLRRVLPVVRHAVRRGALVSIDTTSPEVAAACLELGAHAVNDVSCLGDERLADLVRDAGAALVLMHSRGTPKDMAQRTDYGGDVVGGVLSEWRAAAARARARGLDARALVMDPGLGFAKTAEQSAALLAATARFVREAGAPVLVGASRKSFLRLVDDAAGPKERLGASIAAALHAARAGARVVRVHDVRATRQALELQALLGSREVGGTPCPRA